ncbi:MAG: hypothetical protein NPMRIOTA_110042 [Nitrosopumilales archaeon]|nr:MAG: hypothetical protein NPMRIOTA_110042 [Nitrosopumilales archaeon]
MENPIEIKWATNPMTAAIIISSNKYQDIKKAERVELVITKAITDPFAKYSMREIFLVVLCLSN